MPKKAIFVPIPDEILSNNHILSVATHIVMGNPQGFFYLKFKNSNCSKKIKIQKKYRISKKNIKFQKKKFKKIFNINFYRFRFDGVNTYQF